VDLAPPHCAPIKAWGRAPSTTRPKAAPEKAGGGGSSPVPAHPSTLRPEAAPEEAASGGYGPLPPPPATLAQDPASPFRPRRRAVLLVERRCIRLAPRAAGPPRATCRGAPRAPASEGEGKGGRGEREDHRVS
jgi:hypothetical protein